MTVRQDSIVDSISFIVFFILQTMEGKKVKKCFLLFVFGRWLPYLLLLTIEWRYETKISEVFSFNIWWKHCFVMNCCHDIPYETAFLLIVELCLLNWCDVILIGNLSDYWRQELVSSLIWPIQQLMVDDKQIGTTESRDEKHLLRDWHHVDVDDI